MHVILLAGGWSDEREVSLSGARNIAAALERLGHEVRLIDPALNFQDLMREAAKADFAFVNLHGTPGEDGLFQAMLDAAGCPYQGSSPTPSYLALNKAASKEVFEANDIPTPEWQFISRVHGLAPDLRLDYPVFVKPNKGGSSLGMALVRAGDRLGPALETIFAMNQSALVERYIPGMELTCGILDETPLPLIMIRPRNNAEYFDYDNKYARNGAEEICPAPVDESVTRMIQEHSLRAHKALGLTGYSRADFILGPDGTPYLLELNTLPGMTATSLLPQAAAQVGYDFDGLIAELIRLGLEQRGR